MANLIMRFPGGLPKALTLSYDDGVEQDEKLIEIAEKYGLKGTFNINSGCFPPEDVAYAPGRNSKGSSGRWSGGSRIPTARTTTGASRC